MRSLPDHNNAVKAFKAGLAVIFDQVPELGSSLASSLPPSYRELVSMKSRMMRLRRVWPICLIHMR